MLSKMNDLMGGYTGYTVIVTTKYVQRRRHKKKRMKLMFLVYHSMKAENNLEFTLR